MMERHVNHQSTNDLARLHPPGGDYSNVTAVNAHEEYPSSFADTDLSAIALRTETVASDQIEDLLVRANQIQSQRNVTQEAEKERARAQSVEKLLGGSFEESSKCTISLLRILHHASDIGISAEAVQQALAEGSLHQKWENNRCAITDKLHLPKSASAECIAAEKVIRKYVEQMKDRLQAVLNNIVTDPLKYPDKSARLGGISGKIAELRHGFEYQLNPDILKAGLFFSVPVLGWIYALEYISNGGSALSAIFRSNLNKPLSPALIELGEFANRNGASIIYRHSKSNFEWDVENSFKPWLNPTYIGIEVIAKLR